MTAIEFMQIDPIDQVDQRLINGKYVERKYPYRSRAHAHTMACLMSQLKNWERSLPIREWFVYGYGCPYQLHRDPDTVLCFDSSIIPAEVHRNLQKNDELIDSIPILAVEVVDQSDSITSIDEIINVALQCGVPEFWLVDPYEQIIHQYAANQKTILIRKNEEVRSQSLDLSIQTSEIFE